MPSEHIALHQLPLAPAVEILCCHYALLRTWDYSDLTAPYWRWYWVDRPGASITLRGKRFELVPEQVVLIPANTPFTAHNRSDIGFLYIHFFIEAIYKQPAPAPVVLSLAAAQIRQIRDFASRFPELEREEFSPLFSLPMAFVAQALSLTKSEFWTIAFYDARVAKAIQMIETHYPAAVSNQKLSNEAGMNTNAFIRMFKRVTGQTPCQHLQGLRLKEASSLLHHSKLSIEAIADKIGFNDRQHFNLMFRKSFRITPVQFRKNALKL